MNFRSNRQRKAVMASLRNRARIMVGDGKLPNKYFVGVSNDYEVYDKKNDETTSPFEKSKCLKPKFDIVHEDDDYDVAVDTAENNLGKMQGKGLKAFPATSVTVEDRLSGEVYKKSIGGYGYGDNKFSKEQEAKLKSKKGN